MLEQFHFLEPLWLLALLPLIIVFWLAIQTTTNSRAWEKIIDPNLLPLLLQGEDKNTSNVPKFLLAMVWLIAVIALADPVWEKIPRPIFQTNAARVLVLDLSNSMLIDDLKPSRLARARFKVEDILSREEEGQTGLVLFAGEAFTASPLTRDTETIRSLLKVLNPQIMPAQGSRTDLGLIKAHQLLKQSGINNGQVLLIADGVSKEFESLNAAEKLREEGHIVSVLAVGTEAGGELNFSNKTSVSVKLDAVALNKIAESGGGNYHVITTNNNDLKRLLTSVTNNSALEESNSNANDELQNREWHSTGPWLVLLLLPFAALAFRKGWLLSVFTAFVLIGLVFQPQEVIAAEVDEKNQLDTQWKSIVEKLSKNKAQRANQALLNKQYEKARDLSDDALSLGSAEYKLQNYEAALSNFQQAEGADARYNEGNTLAKLEKYEEAVAAYEKALESSPNMQDALDNKKAIEDFLKQQQQSDKKDESSNENQQGNSDSENKKQEQQNSESKEGQDKQNDSKSGEKSDKQEQQDNDQKANKDEQNQFSDANKEIDKNKEEAEQEKIQEAQNQAAEDSQDKKGNEKSQALKNEDSAEKSDKELEETAKQERIKALAEELNKEEKMAAEQWLRRIPDDPSGLLRRKFEHQFRLNRRNGKPISKEQPW